MGYGVFYKVPLESQLVWGEQWRTLPFEHSGPKEYKGSYFSSIWQKQTKNIRGDHTDASHIAHP